MIDIIYPEGWVDPDAVPEELTPAQLRRALNHFQLRQQLEAAIMQADQDTQDWYNFATVFLRHHERVVAMAEGLGVTPSQMDDLWRYGSGLT